MIEIAIYGELLRRERDHIGDRIVGLKGGILGTTTCGGHWVQYRTGPH